MFGVPMTLAVHVSLPGTLLGCVVNCANVFEPPLVHDGRAPVDESGREGGRRGGALGIFSPTTRSRQGVCLIYEGMCVWMVLSTRAFFFLMLCRGRAQHQV